jgi:hypothetical protein
MIAFTLFIVAMFVLAWFSGRGAADYEGAGAFVVALLATVIALVTGGHGLLAIMGPQ